MYDWLADNLGNIAAATSILAFLLSFAAIAFSAARFVAGWRQAQKAGRFGTYYRVLRIVSTGVDEEGPLKLVSQMAYIHELTKFGEYHPVTYRTLKYLRADWAARENAKEFLIKEVDLALLRIERRRWLSIKLKSDEYEIVDPGYAVLPTGLEIGKENAAPNNSLNPTDFSADAPKPAD